MSWGALPWVIGGGIVGVAAREAVTLALPGVTTTLAINVLGAFFLGLLLAFLAARGEDSGRHRRARLALGTGLLGGFTTYSTLAYGMVALSWSGAMAGLATVILAVAAAALGGYLGGLLGTRRESAI